MMLGRPTMMRLPEIIGVRLTGRRPAGVTATDIVLALTEFLRHEKVVSAYLEFFGEGAADLTIGDRATISNMTPEYGATLGIFPVDEKTIEYLRATNRSDHFNDCAKNETPQVPGHARRDETDGNLQPVLLPANHLLKCQIDQWLDKCSESRLDKIGKLVPLREIRYIGML